MKQIPHQSGSSLSARRVRDDKANLKSVSALSIKTARKIVRGTQDKLGSSGFTLVEILVAQTLLVILISFVYYFWQNTLSTTQSSIVSTQNTQSLSGYLRIITDHIREARDGEDGSYPLFLADDQEIGIFSDIDNDGSTERVRYFLDGTQLKRGVVESSGDPPLYNLGNETVTVIGDTVTNGIVPVFTYYNRDWPGDTTNNPLDPGERLLYTRYITMSLQVGEVSDTGPDPVMLETAVLMRNFKDNY